MLRRILALSLATLAVAGTPMLARSQPPPPAPIESCEPIEQQRGPYEGNAEVLLSLTGALTECQQRAKADAEAANKQASADWWMVWLTGGLLLVAGYQVRAFVRQL